jgi:hypothetical protein
LTLTSSHSPSHDVRFFLGLLLSLSAVGVTSLCLSSMRLATIIRHSYPGQGLALTWALLPPICFLLLFLTPTFLILQLLWFHLYLGQSLLLHPTVHCHCPSLSLAGSLHLSISPLEAYLAALELFLDTQSVAFSGSELLLSLLLIEPHCFSFTVPIADLVFPALLPWKGQTNKFLCSLATASLSAARESSQTKERGQAGEREGSLCD